MNYTTRNKICSLLSKFLFFSNANKNLLNSLLQGITDITFNRKDNIGKYGVQRLAEALQNPDSTVTNLYLDNVPMGDDGVTAIANALKSPDCKLTTLKLPFNEINDYRASLIIDALRSPNCKLTKLGLSDNQIRNDYGAFAITDGLKSPNCKLTQLDLSGNEITNNGFCALADVLKSPYCKLTELYVGRNFSPEERAIIAIGNSLKANMTLTSLTLPFTCILPEVYLNRIIKNLAKNTFKESFVKSFFEQKKLRQDVAKYKLLQFLTNDHWNHRFNDVYWQMMNDIDYLSRFLKYLRTPEMIWRDGSRDLDNQDRIDVKKKIKRRILFLKRNKIRNHVPAQLNERVQNVLYNDVQQQQIDNIGEAIYNIQLRLRRDIQEAVQRGTFHQQQGQQQDQQQEQQQQ